MSGECEICHEHTLDCKCNILQDAWTIDLKKCNFCDDEEDKVDEQDLKEEEPIFCKCGKIATSFIIGKESFLGRCSECEYGKPDPNIQCEYGSINPIRFRMS